MRGHSIQQQNEQVPKVAVRRIFFTSPQLHFASRFTSTTRNISFRRSDFKFLQNESVLSNYALRYVSLVHEPSIATFSQRFASAYANFFAMVVGIIRSLCKC